MNINCPKWSTFISFFDFLILCLCAFPILSRVSLCFAMSLNTAPPPGSPLSSGGSPASLPHSPHLTQSPLSRPSWGGVASSDILQTWQGLFSGCQKLVPSGSLSLCSSLGCTCLEAGTPSSSSGLQTSGSLPHKSSSPIPVCVPRGHQRGCDRDLRRPCKCPGLACLHL